MKKLLLVIGMFSFLLGASLTNAEVTTVVTTHDHPVVVKHYHHHYYHGGYKRCHYDGYHNRVCHYYHR